MNKLVQLSENINNYNLYGSSSTRLAPLKIAILYKKSHQELCKQIAQDLDCQKTHASLELMGLSGYSIMRSGKVSHLELHLISSLTDEETIQDERFLRRKKIIDKLRSDKQCIFLCLDQQYSKGNSKQRQQILDLKRVDSSITKNIIWRGQARLFYIDIVKTWENMHRCQIMGILTKLKAIMKEQQKSLSRSRQWIQVKERTADQLSYALQLITKASDYLTCSLEGYYSKQASHFQIEYSIHWQIMDVFEDLWKQQTEKINKQLEKMPLSYIGESLRMSSCHPISGFIPQACFLRVFKPILLNLAEDVLFCLEGAKFKVIQNIQIIYEYYFTKTTIKDELIERQIHTVEKICDQFLKQVQSAIYAQINYVYAPSQSFWEMRNVQSNLYSQQQQANIQIKYIGKVYVKRVYDSIKDSIPRFVGQGLLRRVSKYFRENSLNNMLEIVKNCEFKISLSKGEIEEIRSREQKLKKYDKVFQYFSLKVSSAFKIKNLTQKNEKRWRQMYHKDKPTQNNPKQNARQNKGFVGWVKGLFKTKPKRQKRSNSAGKHNQSSISSAVVEQANIQKKSSEKIEESAITEKNWILLLNTNKKVEQEKLQRAACQGFPDRLRPSIWFWLATRASEEKQLKMKQIQQKGKMDPQIVRQIEKDLGRTPPPQLFKNNKLRSCLRRVLSAYSLIDQEIKYTQGMNFMVATALATLSHWGARQDYLVDKNDKVNKDELEQKSFIILKFLMLKQGIRRVMFIEREYMAEICFRIQQKIKQMNINVWKMIEGSGFTCEIIFGSILFAGLATWSKHLQVSRRIMDILLVKGFSILYKIVAGVAVMSEQQMKNLRLQQIYDFLRHKSLDDFYQRAGNQGLSQLFLSL